MMTRKDNAMKALAINGSPRKKWNTATLLEHALAGAAEAGADTELVHLYDLDYKGCISCFACKKIGGRSYGRCAVQDGLTPLLDAASQADVLILGSPVYFRVETGEMRSFLERLLFPYLTYTPEPIQLYPGKARAGLVYTMNIPEQDIPAFHQDVFINVTRDTMRRVLGNCEVFLCTDTYQFKDYSKYLSTRFDAAAKAKRREEVFPQDCRRAHEFGAQLVREASLS